MAGAEEFKGMLSDASTGKTFWEKEKPWSLFQTLNIMRKDDVMCDVTILVGSEKTPFKAHRLVLAAAFDYFKAIFSAEMKDSVALPCISPEDMTLLLEFAYKGETDIHQKNVHKVTILAKCFGAEYLLDQCCRFMSQFKRDRGTKKMVKFADCFEIQKLKINLIKTSFTEEEILYAELDKLPVKSVLEVIRHPAAVICDNEPMQNEEMLFQMMMARFSSEDEKGDHILKLLESIHLPQVSAAFLDTTETQFGHIPGVKNLIKEARKEIDPAETREWYLPRYKNKVSVQIADQDNRIVVKGNVSYYYSPCVLVQGFSFFLYVYDYEYDEEELDRCAYDDIYDPVNIALECPAPIEKMILPYPLKVCAQLESGKRYIIQNTYYAGTAEPLPAVYCDPECLGDGKFCLIVERCKKQ